MIWTVVYNKKFVSQSATRTKWEAIDEVARRHPDKDDRRLWDAIPRTIKRKKSKAL